MAYDKTIPVQTNQVRGASGDLVKMKDNFAQLAPVAISGIHGLISGGEAAAAGQVPLSQGAGGSDFHYKTFKVSGLVDTTIGSPTSGQALTWNGSAWVNATPVSTLSGLSDTLIAAPVSGEALTWNGSEWVNDTPVSTLSGLTDTSVPTPNAGEALMYDGTNWVASGSSPRASTCVRLLVDQSVANGLWVTVTGFETICANPAFSTVTSGVKIESGIDKVDVRVNALYDTGTGIIHRTRIQKNGAALGDDASYGLDSQVAQRIGAASADPAVNVMAVGVPVVSGDVISIASFFDSGTQTVASGQLTGITVQDNAQAPGGQGAVDDGWVALFSMASGATFGVPNDTRTAVTAINTEQYNTGGFSLAAGVITVPTGSGYTHIDIQAQALWGTSGTPGDDIDAHLYKDGSEVMFDAAGNPLDSVLDRRTAGRNGIPPVNRLGTNMIPVSGGETFELRVQQVTGGVFDLLGGTGGKGVATNVKIRGHKMPTKGAGVPLLKAYRANVTLVSGDSPSIPNAATTAISGLTDIKFDSIGLTAVTGAITIPVGSGYTHVDIDARITWNGNATGHRDLFMQKDGDDTVYELDGTPLNQYYHRMEAISDASKVPGNRIHAPMIPVSGGDVFQFRCYQNSGAPLVLNGGGAGQNGVLCGVQIRAYKLAT